MLHQSLHHLDLAKFDIVFIENVGNLVCPASFDLGQHVNVTLLSVPEGDDKPAKYPVMFRAADLVLISKCDLLPVLDDFDPGNAKRYLHDIASMAPVIELSAKDKFGMQDWLGWIDAQIEVRMETAAMSVSAKQWLERIHALPHKQEENKDYECVWWP